MQVIKAQHQVLRQVVSREHCHIKALAYLSSTGKCVTAAEEQQIASGVPATCHTLQMQR